MATYVNNLRLTELATGEGSGTWGTTTNTSLELIGEALGYNTQNCFSSDADATTTVADGATDPARSFYFKVTSSATLTATRTLTIGPNTVSRVMFIENATTGSQSITISQGSGANVTIATGRTAVVYLDGAGSGAAVVDAMANVDPGVTDTLAEVLAQGNTTGGTDIAVGTGDDITFADSSKAIFGAGSDLQIYHDGGTSFIDDVGTGNLHIRTDGASIKLRTSANADMIVAENGGAAKLYHAGSQKLTTLSTGIDVTGTLVSDGLTVDAALATINAPSNNADLVLTEGGTNTDARIRNSNGILEIDADLNNEFGNSSMMFAVDGTDRLKINNNGDITFFDTDGSTPSFFYDVSSGLTINEAGADRDFRVESDGQTHALFVDASTDKIGIGESAPATYLDIGFSSLDQTDGIQIHNKQFGGYGGAIDWVSRTAASLGGGSDRIAGQIQVAGANNWASDDNVDSTMKFSLVEDNTLRNILELNPSSEVVINQDSIDMDFRVESDSYGNMFVVDGGTNYVGIRTPPAYLLHVDAAGAEEDIPLRIDGYKTGIQEIWLNNERAPYLTNGRGTQLVFGNNGTKGAFIQAAGYGSGGNGELSMGIQRTGGAGTLQTVLLANSNTDVTFVRAVGSATAPLQLQDSGASNLMTLTPSAVVVNEDGANIDFRVESESNTHMLFVDAGQNAVGINDNAPASVKLTVLGVDTAAVAWGDTVKRGFLSFDGGGAPIVRAGTGLGLKFQSNGTRDVAVFGTSESVFNEPGNNQDFRVESDNNANILFIDASADTVNIGNTTDFGGILNVNGGLNSKQAVFTSTNNRGLALSTASRGGQNDGVAIIDAQDTESTGGRFEIHTMGAERARFERDQIVFNEGSNDQDFRVESNNNANALVVDATNDSVIIGGARQQIGTLEVIQKGGTVDDGLGILGIGGDLSCRIFTSSNVTQIARGSTNAISIDSSANVIINENSGDQDFRVESNGNANMLFVDAGNDVVVIGGTTAETADTLEVISSDTQTNVRFRNTNAGADGPVLIFDKASASPANDDNVGDIRFIGKDSAGNAEQFARLLAESSNVTSGAEDATVSLEMMVNGSNLQMYNYSHVGAVFNDQSSGSLDFRVETTSASHMIYANGGDDVVTFDATSFSAVDNRTSTGVAIRTAGRIVQTTTNGGNAIEFNVNGQASGAGSINVSGTTTTYNTSSDVRLKENIVAAPSASDDIDAIQVRSFDWKADGSHQKYGMVAQELLSIAPDAVAQGETEEDMMGVDYSKLVPMLIKEIQSLRARVAQLESN